MEPVDYLHDDISDLNNMHLGESENVSKDN